jgi:hypothetical protein
MPDFPTQGGTSAADVWAFATREVTNSELGDIAGIKAVTDVIPDSGALTSIAQGADLTAVKAVTDVLPDAGVLSSLAQATDLTAVKAVTDVLPDAGVLSSIAQATDLTAVKAITDVIPDLGAMSSIAQKASTDKLLMAGTPTEASILMDGTDKTLVEFTDVKVGEVEVWVDLNPMVSGDTIVVSYRRKVKSGGTYRLYAQQTYSGAQSVPLLKILDAKIYRDTKVSANQTAKAADYCTLDVQAIRILEA